MKTTYSCSKIYSFLQKLYVEFEEILGRTGLAPDAIIIAGRNTVQNIYILKEKLNLIYQNKMK